jgi:hypothetical protein
LEVPEFCYPLSAILGVVTMKLERAKKDSVILDLAIFGPRDMRDMEAEISVSVQRPEAVRPPVKDGAVQAI